MVWRNLHKEERALAKEMKKRKWYGESDAVIFVQATPGELLKRGIQEVMNENGMNAVC